jgi:hypothetical protein
MKRVEKVPGGLRRRYPKPQLLQPLVLSQDLKIIDTVSTRSKYRNKRFDVISFSILTRSLKKGKMFADNLRQSQSSKGLQGQWKTPERGNENLRNILN